MVRGTRELKNNDWAAAVGQIGSCPSSLRQQGLVQVAQLLQEAAVGTDRASRPIYTRPFPKKKEEVGFSDSLRLYTGAAILRGKESETERETHTQTLYSVTTAMLDHSEV